MFLGLASLLINLFVTCSARDTTLSGSRVMCSMRSLDSSRALRHAKYLVPYRLVHALGPVTDVISI